MLINCIQSIFLDISPDEAYYYVYSKELSWGYFDHPPLVAFFIKIGYYLFNNELGVRLPFILLSGISLILLYSIAELKKVNLFMMLSTSVVAIQVFGFQALPDVPLIFFSLTYLLVLKKYLVADTLKLSLLLSLNIALLVLSKYHGILLIVFTLAALPHLMKRKSFWIILCSTLILLAPHIYWQYTNDFATIRFNFIERNWSAESYTISNTLVYLLIQPLIIGPFIGFLLIWSALKYKSLNEFDRVLKTILWGVYLFFFAMTFKAGEVHPHWTIIAIVPLLILSGKYLEQNYHRFKKTINYLFITSILFFIAGRFFLVYDFVPQSFIAHERIHGIRDWAREIQTETDNYPLVFMNSYEEASRYTFYTNVPAISIGNVMSRKTQFDLMNPDTCFFGNSVCVLPNWDERGFNSFTTSSGKKYRYTFLDHFVYYTKIKIEPNKNNFTVRDASEIQIPIRLVNEHYSDSDLCINPGLIPTISYHIFKNGEMVLEERTPIKVIDVQNTEEYFNFHINLPEQEGEYVLKLGIACGWMPSTNNSTIITLDIK